MLNLDWATVIFQVINFLVLVALLNHFLFQPVIRNVAQRTAEKERLLRELAQEREEAARLRAELEERLAKADEDQALQHPPPERDPDELTGFHCEPGRNRIGEGPRVSHRRIHCHFRVSQANHISP